MSQSIILFTQDIHKAKQEIVSLGGRVTQQFTDSVFVANLPDSVDPQSLSASSPKSIFNEFVIIHIQYFLNFSLFPLPTFLIQ